MRPSLLSRRSPFPLPVCLLSGYACSLEGLVWLPVRLVFRPSSGSSGRVSVLVSSVIRSHSRLGFHGLWLSLPIFPEPASVTSPFCYAQHAVLASLASLAPHTAEVAACCDLPAGWHISPVCSRSAQAPMFLCCLYGPRCPSVPRSLRSSLVMSVQFCFSPCTQFSQFSQSNSGQFVQLCQSCRSGLYCLVCLSSSVVVVVVGRRRRRRQSSSSVCLSVCLYS